VRRCDELWHTGAILKDAPHLLPIKVGLRRNQILLTQDFRNGSDNPIGRIGVGFEVQLTVFVPQFNRLIDNCDRHADMHALKEQLNMFRIEADAATTDLTTNTKGTIGTVPDRCVSGKDQSSNHPGDYPGPVESLPEAADVLRASWVVASSSDWQSW